MSKKLLKKNKKPVLRKKKKVDLTSIQEVVHYFFKLKDWNYEKDKKKLGPVFRRYLRPAKELLKLANNDIGRAKHYLEIIKRWADATNLEWSIETVFKRWFDIINEKLPQEPKKNPYYQGNLMRKGYDGRWRIFIDSQWKIFAGKESEIEWK